MEPTIENLEKHGQVKVMKAVAVVREDQLRELTWDDLVDNARKIRRRRTGKDYSPAWIKNTKTLLSTVDFPPVGLTPQRVHRWLDEQEKKGLSAVTMKNRASALQALIERAITNGYQPGLAPNVFRLVDFSVNKDVETENSYYCPTPADYRKLFNEVLPQQPERIAVGIELMCWTGVRVCGVPYLKESSDPGWLDVPDVHGTKGGGRTPVPMELWIRGRDVKVSVQAMNQVLKQVHPELCNHSLRSGFKMLTRLAGIDSQVGESLLMHKLKDLERVFGGPRFPDESLKAGAERTWQELEKILRHV